MRTKEYLAAGARRRRRAVLETRFFADEMRDPRQEISNLPGSVDLSSREVQMASQLIEAMTGHGTRGLPGRPAGSALTDLTQALQASLDAARKPRAKKRSAEKPPGAGAA
jgi:DNA end-binding protein Ku